MESHVKEGICVKMESHVKEGICVKMESHVKEGICVKMESHVKEGICVKMESHVKEGICVKMAKCDRAELAENTVSQLARVLAGKQRVQAHTVWAAHFQIVTTLLAEQGENAIF